VAEGVETRGQLALLADLGCDLVQGWLFSRAVPGEEFAALLTAGRLA
jgi:EAL domain-containing protein (putative c-di-GMP-specific phosphodiesterase class I)